MANSTDKKIYMIDGKRFGSLAETAAEFTRVLGLTTPWLGNLDAFNDFLNGGFGTPYEGFILIWQNSEISRQRLGYAETVRRLQRLVDSCHSSNLADVQERIAAAGRSEGATLFDELVDIIRDHGNIELRLE